MKSLFCLAVFVSLWLLTGCASTPPPNLSGAGPQVGELTIISAVYGSSSHFADVTERVQQRLHADNGEFYANPEWLKADPTPGWNKELVITYEYAGQRKTFNAGENTRITYKILLNYAKNRRPDRVNNPI
jgi:arabinogalactan endo-1,4-beta-galactosidase